MAASLPRFRHHGIECGNLCRDPIRVIDALGSQRLLERRSDAVAALEDQRERLGKANPAEVLQLGDAMALISARDLVRAAGTDVGTVDAGRSFDSHQHLHEREAERCQLSHVETAAGAPLQYLTCRV